MIDLLIVEDSPSVRQLLAAIFGSDPDIRIVAAASSAEEALEILRHGRPDVITMDIVMPGMDGLQATRLIMETDPVPIVIVTASWEPSQVDRTFQALDAGAVAIVEKPDGPGHPEYARTAKHLLQTVKSMAEVKLVKRRPQSRVPTGVIRTPGPEPEIVAIGASTGGPPVIKTILSGLASGFPLPLLIVQHIVVGFQEGMVRWIRQATGFPLDVAREEEPIVGGRAYLAPDGFHLGVRRDGRIGLTTEPPEYGMRPSVSRLFRSVAAAYGGRAVGILLTGMGEDGARELHSMRQAGALTIAQDGESAVVDGMPGKARELDGAAYVLPPEGIAPVLNALAAKNRGGGGIR